MKRLIAIILIAAILPTLSTQAQKPIGWATCATHEGGRYQMKGADHWKSKKARQTRHGEGRRDTILYSNGGDMYNTVLDAITRFDKVILDGSKGAFTLSQRISLIDIKHKTIEGRNAALLETAFVVDEKIHAMLDGVKVKQYSSMAKEGEVFHLSNGRQVKEACEYKVRQCMIDYLNDPNEDYRMAGIFSMIRCEDIILRNLILQGPGAVDVSGKDVLTIGESSHHIWVDHCDFIDGMDGNFDINTFADFITVSYCTFSYTERSYMHQNTNLIGSSDNAQKNGEDCLNVTFYHCTWGKGCDQRMPMVRFGKIHLLKCIYDCPGARLTVNPRIGSEVLMEGCIWKKGVSRIFSANNAKAYEFRNCTFEEPFEPKNLGTVRMPYNYKKAN